MGQTRIRSIYIWDSAKLPCQLDFLPHARSLSIHSPTWYSPLAVHSCHAQKVKKTGLQSPDDSVSYD